MRGFALVGSIGIDDNGRRAANAALAALAAVTAVLALLAVTRGGHTVPVAAITRPRTATTSALTVPTMADARAVVARPNGFTVLVLGDSTGNEMGEWVGLWAKHFSADHQVTLHLWDFKKELFPPTPVHWGATGPKVEVWNLSQPGARSNYAANRLGQVLTKPDLVLYSYGHNDPSGTQTAALALTQSKVHAKWGRMPEVIVLQNPSNGATHDRQAANIAMLKTWALPKIDVYSAFPTDPAKLAKLLMDDVHPNHEGEQLWYQQVLAALG